MKHARFSLFLAGLTVTAVASAEDAPAPAPQPATSAPAATTVPAATVPSAEDAPAPAPQAATSAVPAATAVPSAEDAPAPQAATSAVPAVASAPGVPAPAADAPAADAVPAGTSARGVAPPAAPPRFNVGLGVDQLWHTQKSYDLFSSNDLQSSLHATLGYAVWLSGPWSVVPELGLGHDETNGEPAYGGVLHSGALESWRGSVGVRVRYLLLPFLEPHVRASGGLEALQASIATSSGETFRKDSLPVFATVGAGFSLHTEAGALNPSRSGLADLMLGATLEGGVNLGPSIDLDLAPDGATSRVPTSITSLGTLGRTGPYLRIAADVRF